MTLQLLEYVSSIERIKKAYEPPFSPQREFGAFRKYLSHAVEHCAKADTQFLQYLIEKYSHEGDLVVDSMAGTCSALTIASLLGRRAAGTEIETRFLRWTKETKRKLSTSLSEPSFEIVHGDARHFPIREANLCVTSPPYHNRGPDAGDLEARARRLIEAGKDPSKYLNGRARGWTLKAYDDDGDSPANIGNLKGPLFFESLKQCYGEIYSSLVDEGIIAVLIKPVFQNKQVLDLPLETYNILREIGFTLHDVVKFRLQNPGAWWPKYYRDNPSLPRLMHEYAVVCKK